MELSRRSKGISESITLAIDAKAKAMKAQGLDVVGFGAGEPDFPTPQWIVDAGHEALDKGITKYTPASGTPQLKQAICDKLKKDNGLIYQPKQIVVSNGAKHSLYNAFQAILNPGDEVIIPGPYWVTYPETVKMADGVPVFVDTTEESGFLATVEQLQKAITPKTKALILNNPSNPCGGLYNVTQLKAIADLCVEKQIIVVSDEIYEDLVYDGEQAVSIASFGEEIKNLTIVVNGLSKSYAMTGWRIGYTASTPEIAEIMGNIQSHATSNPNSIAQYASVAALQGDKGEVKKMVAEFDRRRLFMVDRINSIAGLSAKPPKGAFYVMMNISGVLGKKDGDVTIDGSMTFAAQLLEAQQTAVVPGIAFGADELVRLSYATSMQNIEKGLDRIETFVKSLKA